MNSNPPLLLVLFFKFPNKLTGSALFLSLKSPDLWTNKPLFLTENTVFQPFISHCFLFPILFTTPRQVHPLLWRGLGRHFLWTIFTFSPPYFLFFLPNPSFPLFVTLRFSMRYTWCCKRACFALQKGVFYISKGHLLPCKRCSFTTRKSIYWIPIMKNLVSNSLFLLSKTYWKAFQPFILTYSSQSTTPTFLRRLTVVNVSFLFPAGSDVNSNLFDSRYFRGHKVYDVYHWWAIFMKFFQILFLMWIVSICHK